MNAQDTSAEPKPDLPLEIAHVLLIDVVGYSKLLVDEQIELLQDLNQIVRSTECFRAAETKGKLIRVSTGDGMALLFFYSPEEPVRCEKERHSVSRRHSIKFAACFRSAKRFRSAHDLIQLLEQFNLLVDQQFRITDHVD